MDEMDGELLYCERWLRKRIVRIATIERRWADREK